MSSSTDVGTSTSGEAECNEMSSTINDADDANAVFTTNGGVEGNIPPPIVDPLSFPRTDQ